MTIIHSILLFILGLSVFHTLRYLLLAGGTYRLFWVRRRAWAEARRLQPARGGGGPGAFPRAQLRREFLNSVQTSVLFGFIFAPMLAPATRGFTRIYSDVHEYGIAYLIASFVALVFINDTYFYWMHRLIHHPRLFRRVHAVHHESRAPNPLTAYSFSLSEGVLEFIWVWPAVLLLPVHELALAAFGVFALALNIVGHLGFECYPEWTKEHALLKWLNRPTYHDEHHRLARGNYGLYFTFWDRWMGTLRDKARAEAGRPPARARA